MVHWEVNNASILILYVSYFIYIFHIGSSQCWLFPWLSCSRYCISSLAGSSLQHFKVWAYLRYIMHDTATKMFQLIVLQLSTHRQSEKSYKKNSDSVGEAQRGDFMVLHFNFQYIRRCTQSAALQKQIIIQFAFLRWDVWSLIIRK